MRYVCSFYVPDFDFGMKFALDVIDMQWMSASLVLRLCSLKDSGLFTVFGSL